MSRSHETASSDPMICGILHEWVNYGKGWKARWSILQGGVLSFYKPRKIVLNQDIEKLSRVIGHHDESMKKVIMLRKDSPTNITSKPVAQIHLKVSSIRESQSNDKRFSIFTGTKRLHMRAKTREDRIAWIEALRAAKERFLRISKSPVDDLVVSTEKLKKRLLEEGVRGAAIHDSEQIMKDELASMQNQLLLWKHKQRLLMDSLRQFDVRVVISRITSLES